MGVSEELVMQTLEMFLNLTMVCKHWTTCTRIFSRWSGHNPVSYHLALESGSGKVLPMHE